MVSVEEVEEIIHRVAWEGVLVVMTEEQMEAVSRRCFEGVHYDMKPRQRELADLKAHRQEK